MTAAIGTFAICTSLLTIKCVACNIIAGQKKAAAGLRPKEDYPDGPPAAESAAKEEFDLWINIRDNNLENIPLFLIVSSAALIGVTSSFLRAWYILNMILFVVARFGWLALYLQRMQPWRSIAWSAGLLAMAMNILIAIIGAF